MGCYQGWKRLLQGHIPGASTRSGQKLDTIYPIYSQALNDPGLRRFYPLEGPMSLVLICGSVVCMSLVQWDASGLQDYAVYEAPSLQESLYSRFLCSHEVVSSMTSCISRVWYQFYIRILLSSPWSKQAQTLFMSEDLSATEEEEACVRMVLTPSCLSHCEVVSGFFHS